MSLRWRIRLPRGQRFKEGIWRLFIDLEK